MDDDVVKIIKDTLEIIKILNEQKKDYVHSLLKVCIALIISFTVIICCFYALYFTMSSSIISPLKYELKYILNLLVILINCELFKSN